MPPVKMEFKKELDTITFYENAKIPTLAIITKFYLKGKY